MSRPPWLVTGASGFLGRHLLQRIEEAGPVSRAVALVRDLDEWRAMPWTGALARVDPLVGGVTQPAAWEDAPALDGIGGIFHLAALVRHCRRDAEEVYRTNVEGTLNLVRVAGRRRCRMVLVSTSGTVGCFQRPDASADEGAPFCEDAVRRWPYYHSKVVAERLARSLAEELGVDLVIARPPVLLGPGDHRFRSSNHVRRFLSGKVPFVIDGGMHFADVRDVSAALLRMMELPRVRPVYHLPGTVCSIREFYGMVAQVSGRAAPRVALPFRLAWWLARLSAPLELLPDRDLIEMASHHWSVHSLYAGPELGYRSRPASETLADTVAWLRANDPASEAFADSATVRRPAGPPAPPSPRPNRSS